MQDIIEIFASVIKKLENENIPYMVVGSIASMIYGEARLTRDLDLVIDILPNDSFKLEKLFSLKDFYCPPLEVLKSEIIHRGQFNLIHHESGLKIDMVMRKTTEHSIEEFKRKRKTPFWNNFEVYVATPEDVILKKLDFYRMGGSEKHITDIRGILAETEIDRAYLHSWIKKLGLSTEWQKVSSL